MSLKEKLLQDMKDAMKNKETIRKNTIQLVRSGVLQIEKDNKELKKRRDSLPEFEKSGRMDLIENLNKEIEVLLAYLPEQLSEGEIKQIVQDTINEVGATTMKDMGKVMGAVSPKVKGRADNKIVSGFVKELLTK